MKKTMIIILMALSINAVGQSRIISGVGERPAGIQHARETVYFNSPAGEFTNFEISISCQGSGQIYYFTWETFRDFNHYYHLPGSGFTYVATFICYNSTTGNFQTFTKTIEL